MQSCFYANWLDISGATPMDPGKTFTLGYALFNDVRVAVHIGERLHIFGRSEISTWTSRDGFWRSQEFTSLPRAPPVQARSDAALRARHGRWRWVSLAAVEMPETNFEGPLPVSFS